MPVIRRYIFIQVMLFILGVMAFFLGIDALINLITLSEDLANATLLDMLWLTLLSAPQKIYFYLPVAVLLGTLIALGAMANNRELIILRSVGTSLFKIYWYSLRPAILLSIIALAISEWVIPQTERLYQNTEHRIEKPEKSLSVKKGIWQKDGEEFFNIDEVRSNGELVGITRFKFNQDGQLVESGFAERALYDDEQWYLQDEAMSLYKDTLFLTQTVTSRHWDTNLNPELFDQLLFEPSQLAPSKLYTYIKQVKQQGLRADELELSLWTKLFQPIVVAIMVFIALSFIFGPLRQMSSSIRIVAGIVAGLMYTYSQEFFTRLGLVYQIDPLISILLPLMIFACFGVYLIRRAG